MSGIPWAAVQKGSAANPCCCPNGTVSLSCQTKSSTGASLCGYVPFTGDDGTRWRTKKISGDVELCVFPTAGCGSNCPGTYPNSYYSTYIPASGDGWDIALVAQSATVPTDPVYPGWWYLVQTCTHYYNGVNQGDGGLCANGHNHYVKGDTFAVSNCHDFTAQLWAFYLGCYAPSNGNLEAPGSTLPASALRDHWDTTNQYNKDTCGFTQANASTRISVSNPSACPGSSGGSQVAGPSAADYGPLSSSSIQRLQWTLTGLATCKPYTTQYAKMSGSYTEQLQDEDTPADAAQRAANGISTWTPATSCAVDGTAYIVAPDGSGTSVAWRDAQCQANAASLTPGGSYTLEVTFKRRVAGSSGPFLPYAVYDMSFSPAGSTWTSPWIDVPNDEGWETQASGAAITSP